MLALLLLLQGPVAAAAPDSLPQITLAEALQRAAQLDPNYVSALGQVDNAAWARRNAFAAFILPAVTVSVNAQRSNPLGFLFAGDTFFVVKTTWQGQLTARYDLFLGGQKFAELSRSAAELEGQALLVGVINKVEIWNPAKFAETVRGAASGFERQATDIFR